MTVPKNDLRDEAGEEITHLFKRMLEILADMKQDHDFHYNKLYDEIPSEYHSVINAANHFTPSKVSWIRKKILDVGNESKRNLENEIEKYEITCIFK